MSKEKPEAEDGLGEDIENGIGDDLRINTDDTSTISNTPDAANMLACTKHERKKCNVHWVDSPEDQSETSNGSEESLGLAVLVGSCGTAVEGELVDNDQVGNAGNGVPSPLSSICVTEGSEETGEDHDHIGHDGDEDASTVEAGKERQIEEQEWCGHGPVDISSPVNLAVDGLICVWDMLVGLDLDNLVEADSITACHSIV